MKRIKVICESGLPHDAKIIDADTGEPIENCETVDIHMDDHNPVRATVTLIDVQVEVVAEVVKVNKTRRMHWRV
jgi:hypothetical protein